MRYRLAALTTVLAFAVSLAACAGLTTGRDFPSPKPGAEIKNGVTTKADLLKMYGDPTQVGMKDGDQTWTWYFWKKGSGKEGDLSKPARGHVQCPEHGQVLFLLLQLS